MILMFVILIWLLCGLLAFRLDCRNNEEYEYKQGGFDGFFIVVLFGGLSFVLFIVFFISEKIENLDFMYDIKKKLYEFIVGKESRKKKMRRNKKFLL